MSLLRLLRKVRPYSGAAILFCTYDSTGAARVLLGQRLYRPYAGHWSLPGGGMERCDGGSFRACAAREAFEETVGLPKLKGIEQLLRERLDAAPEHRVQIPFCFDFRSYLLPLRTMPNLRLWPNMQSWGNEFRQFRWFRADDLPAPLHPYLLKTLDSLLTAA